MLKRFIVSPWSDHDVTIHFDGQLFRVTTDESGYFLAEIEVELNPGWKSYKVKVDTGEKVLNKEGEVLIADPSDLIISDIDDTILVSHATSLIRKLYLLLSRNPQQRKPFKGIVDSYNSIPRKEIPFVFVSSSEWNLYDFIKDFCEYNEFPKGVYFLQKIKRWKDLFRSGGGDHMHKLEKIEQLLNLFPKAKFHLVGDSGQRDAAIYTTLALKYTDRVRSIHIRDLKKRKVEMVKKHFDGLPDSVFSELFEETPDFVFIQ